MQEQDEPQETFGNWSTVPRHVAVHALEPQNICVPSHSWVVEGVLHVSPHVPVEHWIWTL